MPAIHFNCRVWDVQRRAESDPEAAAEALQIAAQYIRENQPMPDGFREWFANALDDAALKPASHRAKALTDALHLTANNRRPGDWVLIGGEFEDLVFAGESVTAAADALAAAHGIDQRTARRYWRMFLEAKALHDSID